MSQSNAIAEYDATTGAVIKSTFIPIAGNDVSGMSIADNNIYVLYSENGSDPLAVYNATTGAEENSNLIPGVSGNQVLVYDGVIYISSSTGITEYDEETGSYIGEIMDPNADALAAEGNYLYITYGTSSGNVDVYDLATNYWTSIGLITGLNDPTQIQLVGDELYISTGNGTVSVYQAATGSSINSSLVTGLPDADGLAVGFVSDDGEGGGPPGGIPVLGLGAGSAPEPTSGVLSLIVLAMVAILRFARVKNRKS